MSIAQGTPTPWSYFFIRLLFKFVLKIFYGTIVVENADFIPKAGEPCIVCANHTNSLTDALLLVAAVPSKRRGLLRLTAKATQFGKKTFTSWLIESAGTVPIQRPKDYGEGKVDNSQVMASLMDALELGDAVCLFPEGASRYHPSMAPLKTGVARLLSDTLSRNRDNPEFAISVLTCSVTYMHRQHFRSDVLVTFHPAMKFKVKDHPELLTPVDYAQIRLLTAQMHREISAGTLDSPSWDLIRAAKLATRMYAPLGTRMSLGDYVRVVRTFLEAFKMSLPHDGPANEGSTGSAGEADERELSKREDTKVLQIRESLSEYQNGLVSAGIKDDRVRRPLARVIIVRRMLVRLAWSLILFCICLPGLVLWLPIFFATWVGVTKYLRTGPIWDTYDEIAQYKLIYGLFSGLTVWGGCVLLTLPIAPFTVVGVPIWLWLSLRWFEDAVSAFRAFMALRRMLWIDPTTMAALQTTRRELHEQVMGLATGTLGLAHDPETFFLESGGKEKGRARGKWESRAKYFSLRRRRKRDWNETLRLYDKVDYPE